MNWAKLLPIIILCSCSNSHQEIGKYVYVDALKTIHIERQCASKPFENPKTKDERMANAEGVEFIDTCEIKRKYNTDNSEYSYAYGFCPKCIDDDIYFHITTIMKHNERCDIERKWLYNKLKNSGYDMEEYNLFVYHIADTQKRKSLYFTAIQEGWNVGTYDEFSTLLGFETMEEL